MYCGLRFFCAQKRETRKMPPGRSCTAVWRTSVILASRRSPQIIFLTWRPQTRATKHPLRYAAGRIAGTVCSELAG
jgi:hypothetical protein